jgi:uncharacterized protein YndB with AHSA1/START domain
MASALDVSVTDVVDASPARVRKIMFDPRQDPSWMAAVKRVEPLTEELRSGARVRRIGRFLGRTLRWTTEVTSVSAQTLDLQIVDGPMRGTVTYLIEPEGAGSRVTIRNVGHAPGFAPRWLLTFAMRRSLAADLRRLAKVAESEQS